MGENHENLLKVVRHCQESLDKYTESRNDGKLLHYLQKLYKLPIKVVHLEQTGVGRTVNGLRKLGGDVGDSAKSLVAKWKEMVVGEQEEEDEDDDDDDDDDEEDGYQTGEEQSDSDDQEKVNTSSSHRKSENRSEDRKSRESSRSDSSKKERHKHNGHKHKSHKRKEESEESEEESPRKRVKREEAKRRIDSEEEKERRHKERRLDSEDDEETRKEKKHKKPENKKSRDSFPDSKSNKKEKQTDRDRKVRKEDNKRHEHSSKTKDEKKKKSKDRSRDRDDEKKPKKKSLNGNLSNNGIDSGSGASFAEALGMCEPSSSSTKPVVKKKPEKKEKTVVKVEDPVPKLLKEIAVEPMDLNLSSLLPTITPNYRPLGNLISLDNQSKKFLSESETLSNIISSKNQRTKVYSGNKMGTGKVPSLFELCTRILQDNIDALEYTGGVPYTILKPILEKATPNQLYTMEHHNPYLIEDTDELWGLHCQKEFRNKRREEMETWREMYLRCLDERDAKLKALTANIKQSQDKSLPVRMTKLAYVDAVAKPPRNIARKQAKNGTAFDLRKPVMTPSAKLSTLATSGDAGKVAVPNPGARAAERASGHVKPKKAPLMLKSISSFKNRFKR